MRITISSFCCVGYAILAVIIQATTPSPTQAQASTASTGPELVLQSGHSQSIWGMEYSPDGKTLATGDLSNSIKLWDVATGHELRSLPGSGKPVFSHDGQWIAARGKSDDRGNIRAVTVWDIASGQELLKLTGYKNSLDSLAFSPDRRWLAGCGLDGGLVWDLETGHAVKVLKGATNSIAFSPDGRWVVAGDGLGDGKSFFLRIWKVGTWEETNAIVVGSTGLQSVTSLVITADSKHVISGHENGGLRVWDISTGQEINAKQVYVFDLQKEGRKAINWLSMSLDGRFIASGNTKAEVNIWNAATLEQLSVPIDYNKNMAVLALSPDGSQLALADSDPKTGSLPFVKVIEVPSGRNMRQLGSFTPAVTSVAFSPDDRWLAIGGSVGVQFWEVATGQMLHGLGANSGSIWTLSYRPDSKQLATSHYGDRVSIWESVSGREVKNVSSGASGGAWGRSIAYSPDGRNLAMSWKSLRANSFVVMDAGVQILDAATGQETRTLKGDTTRESLGIAFSPDGKTLASSHGFDKTLKVWNVASGRQLFTLPAPQGSWEMGKPVFSQNGRFLVASVYNGDDDKSVLKWATRVWDANSGQLVRELSGQPLPNYAFSPSKLLFTRDSKRLLALSSYNAVDIWDFDDWKKLKTLGGHSGLVRDFSISPNETRVASASDVSVRIWDLASGMLLATLIAPDKGREWLVVSPDGLFDGSPGGWNQVLWRFNNNTFDTAPVEVFFNEYYYPGLLAEILAGRVPKAKVDISRKDRRQPQLKLSLANYKAGTSISARQVQLQLEVQEAPANASHAGGSGVRDVRLFRNGSLVKVWRGELRLGKDGRTTLQTPVTLITGENKFSAYGFNRDNIKSSDATLTLNGAESLKRTGIAYILAVGLNRYANPAYDLQFAVPDAKAIAEQVEQQQTRLGAYAKVEVVLLQDNEAAKDNILMALSRLSGDAAPLPATAPASLKQLQPAQPEDAVLVYYAGHGTAAGPRFYLIPHDLGYTGGIEKLDSAGMNMILGHSISDLELQKAFERIDAGQLLLVIDACNSGQALEAEEKRRGPMNSAGLAQLAYEKGINVLTAAQGYQAAIEATQYGHGLLTYALVEEGLKTAMADTQPRDGQVVVREWLDYATQRVPQIQEKLMLDFRKMGRNLAFIEGEQTVEDLADRSLQRPRVFYRREPEARPLVMVRPEGSTPTTTEPVSEINSNMLGTESKTEGGSNLFEALGRLFKGKSN
jgi:WD40 repeat protein